MNNGPDKMRAKSLRAMDTATLRSLLMLEISAEGDLNVARIQEISDIIAEREQISVPDVDAAWNDFQQNYISSEPIHTLEQDCFPVEKPPVKRKRWKRIAVIAAVMASLLIGATLTADAVNFDLWRAVAKWTSETFGFSSGDSNARSTSEIENVLENDELAPLWNVMIERGLTNPRLPTYLPEGFKQVELKNHNEDGFWCATYQSGNDLIYIQVQRSQEETWSKLQKDGIEPDPYTWNGTDFYIMTNMGQSVVSWTSDQYEYSIFGASEPEIYKMIESIQKEAS